MQLFRAYLDGVWLGRLTRKMYLGIWQQIYSVGLLRSSRNRILNSYAGGQLTETKMIGGKNNHEVL